MAATGRDAGYPRPANPAPSRVWSDSSITLSVRAPNLRFPVNEAGTIQKDDIVRCLTLLGCLTPPQAFLAGEYG
jgi:hypothetical protein